VRWWRGRLRRLVGFGLGKLGGRFVVDGLWRELGGEGLGVGDYGWSVLLRW